MYKITFLLLISCFAALNNVKAQSGDVLKEKILNIIKDKKMILGAAITDAKGKDMVLINGDRRCVLQSVFKMHIALAVLSEVDKGKLALNQNVTVNKSELLPDLWSPLREENPEGGVFTIERLIQYAVSQSDNVACDVLIRMLGSPVNVEKFSKKHKIADISIKINEEVMQAKWENMYQNWTTPKATNLLLKTFLFNKNKQLSASSHDFFWRTMTETSTGKDRLKALLPEGTKIAHKTGSSGTNKEGLTAATNDVGVIYLPDGSFFFISVFVAESHENASTNARVIAEIGKAAYDFFTFGK